MATVTLEDKFHGTCVLTILHLRRAAKSNDLEVGFTTAREMHMLGPDHESFVRDCLQLDEELQAGAIPHQPITEDLIRELQACVLRLNTADPA